MPYVTNPTDLELFCHPLARVLAAHEEVEITDDVATAISRSVFVVSDQASPKPSVEAEDSDTESDGGGESTPATRKRVSRGSQTVEESGAPEHETR